MQTLRQYIEQDSETVDWCEFANGQAVVYSRRSPDKHSPNEDAAALIPVGDEQGVIVVADGCGGMRSGNLASRITVESLSDSISQMLESQQLRTAILDGFEAANVRLQTSGTGAATTLAIVEIDRHSIRTYHAGDSQILVVGNHGKVKLQTVSHSPVGYAVFAGILTEEEAVTHEARHLVSNVVGTKETHIEIGSRRALSLRDTVLVASDGLFDNLRLDQIVETIRKGPLDDAARQLAAEASERMLFQQLDEPSKPDDLTFALYRRLR